MKRAGPRVVAFLALAVGACGGDPWASRDGGCDPFGSTQLCGEYCELPCPGEMLCPGNVCYDLADHCEIHLERGGSFRCRAGHLCLTAEQRPDGLWNGTCVDPELCGWLLTYPGAIRAYERCRYSEGTPFVNGPPDHECAPGADPLAPFCGGACGDEWHARGVGSCAGISETRGFGVWAPTIERCRPADPGPAMAGCELWSGAAQCVCMVLSPTAAPPEFAENGWAVARQSCGAYRDRFPGEVRCFDATWTEIP